MNQPQRYQFLDLYRGLIVLFMLEGHVLRALLTPAFQATKAFEFHELFHSITAPGFLFGAGFAFAIATQRKWGSYTSWSPRLLRRMGRLVVLIAVGYLLHIPYFSLRKTLEESTPEQWDALFAFDVLQCIGISLLILRLLFVLVRSEKIFLAITAIFLVAIAFTTPLVWSESLGHSLPRWLAQAVNGLQGAFFPLFPYAAYVLAGVLVSWEFLRFAEQNREPAFMKNLALLGIGLIAVGVVWNLVPITVYTYYDEWITSPAYFFICLGILMLFLGGLWYYESRVTRRESGDAQMPAWLITLGVESLFVYIAHLMLLYGWVLNPELNMEERWALRLNLGESLLVGIAFTIILAALARLWHYGKKHHPVIMQGVYWWMGLVLTWELLTRMY